MAAGASVSHVQMEVQLQQQVQPEQQQARQRPQAQPQPAMTAIDTKKQRNQEITLQQKHQHQRLDNCAVPTLRVQKVPQILAAR